MTGRLYHYSIFGGQTQEVLAKNDDRKKNVFYEIFTSTSGSALLSLDKSRASMPSGYAKSTRSACAAGALIFQIQPLMMFGVAFFSTTSWLPPSTMEVEETTVSLAFCCSSGMESAPQLHMVLLTLYRVVWTPSASGPA